MAAVAKVSIDGPLAAEGNREGSDGQAEVGGIGGGGRDNGGDDGG